MFIISNAHVNFHEDPTDSFEKKIASSWHGRLKMHFLRNRQFSSGKHIVYVPTYKIGYIDIGNPLQCNFMILWEAIDISSLSDKF